MDNLEMKSILCFQDLVQFKIGKNLVYGEQMYRGFVNCLKVAELVVFKHTTFFVV